MFSGRSINVSLRSSRKTKRNCLVCIFVELFHEIIKVQQNIHWDGKIKRLVLPSFVSNTRRRLTSRNEKFRHRVYWRSTVFRKRVVFGKWVLFYVCEKERKGEEEHTQKKKLPCNRYTISFKVRGRGFTYTV